MRQRLSFQRISIDRVSGITGGADRDPQDGREFVVVDTRDEPVDDVGGMLEVGIDRTSDRTPCSVRPIRSVSRTSFPMISATSCTVRRRR